MAVLAKAILSFLTNVENEALVMWRCHDGSQRLVSARVENSMAFSQI